MWERKCCSLLYVFIRMQVIVSKKSQILLRIDLLQLYILDVLYRTQFMQLVVNEF